MSIVVKGFDKPEDCYTCPFNHSDWYCNLTKGIIDRDNWDCSVVCPIKELPKGHGRLIDADEYKEHLYTCETNGRPLHIMELDERLATVDDAPTILEEDRSEEE